MKDGSIIVRVRDHVAVNFISRIIILREVENVYGTLWYYGWNGRLDCWRWSWSGCETSNFLV